MEITIKPDDIDQYVKEAVLKSSLGGQIKEAIDKSFKSVLTTWNNPIEVVIKKEMENVIADYIRQPENICILNQIIIEHFTKDVIEEIIKCGLRKFAENLNN